MATTSENGIFINGKAQIIEMLQLMTPQEKNKILGHIKLKNPGLASELEEKSFSFKDLFNLKAEHLKMIFEITNPPILGIGIRSLPNDLQRKILSLVPRQYAEIAFTWMTKSLSDEGRDIGRAQEKIMNNAAITIKKIRS